MTQEIEHTIPQAGDIPARLGRIEAAIAQFGATLDEVKRALVGGLDGAPGIYQRLGGHENALKDHEERIEVLEARADSARDKTGDRAWVLVLGALGATIAQMIAYVLNHGAPHR